VNIWRDVTSFELHGGRGLRAASRRTRWWVLSLTCGHRAERHVRYRKLDPPRPKGSRRLASEVLPPPARISCRECTRAVLKEMFS